MTLKELREIANRANVGGKLTVFVRGGNYVVRREGIQRHVMQDAEHMARSLSYEGVNGVPQVHKGQRHFYAVDYAEVIIPREQA